MKSIIIIALILTSFLSFSQEPIPDSLVGIYEGELYYRIQDNDWVLINSSCFEYVTGIDTGSCYVSFNDEQSIMDHAIIGNPTTFKTKYAYCSGTWDSYQPLFFGGDSLTLLLYLNTGPPDYEDYYEKFIGKHIPGSTSVGLQEITKEPSKVSVFPNPSTEKLIIKSSREKIKAFEIYSISGKKIIEKDVANLQIEIDISQEPKGIYFVKITTAKAVTIQKLIIE